MPSDRCLSCLYYGQMVGWIKMELGMELGLSPGHIVLDRDPAPPPQRGTAPAIFGTCMLWPNSWMDQDTTWYGGRPRPKQHCVRTHPPKKGHSPPLFGPCLLRPNGWMDQDATWYEGMLQPRPHCVGRGPSSLSPKRAHPPIFGPCLLWPNARPSQLLLSSCYYSRDSHHYGH